MEKIYLLCFTKGDFITKSYWTTENDGGGYVIQASKHLESLQMRMREEVNTFVEKRLKEYVKNTTNLEMKLMHSRMSTEKSITTTIIS